MSPFDREMQRSLEAGGEKLRQLTSEDHGPFALEDITPPRFKVVCRDNFDRDYVSEYWLLETSVSKATAEVIAQALNEELCSESSQFFAAVVPSDHKLYVWEP